MVSAIVGGELDYHNKSRDSDRVVGIDSGIDAVLFVGRVGDIGPTRWRCWTDQMVIGADGEIIIKFVIDN